MCNFKAFVEFHIQQSINLWYCWMLQGQIKERKFFLFCAANLKLIYFLYMLGEFSVSEVGQQTTKCYCYTLLFCVKEMSPLFSKYHTEFQQLCIPHVNTAFCKECEKRAPHTLLNFSLKHLFWIKLFLILQQIYVDWKSALSVFLKR